MSLRAIRDVAAKAGLLLGATAIGLLTVELGLRLIYPVSIMSVDGQATHPAGDGSFEQDQVLGFRPALDGRLYDANGILRDRSTVSKADGAYKLLFIGDSVTAYGHIVNGLANLLGSETTSFLNGGVAGYNIQQEIEFFLRYQKAVKPDAIIHQFHINDFHASRLLLRGRDGTVRIYSPRLKPVDVNQTLYRYSQLYRFLLANFLTRYSKEELRTEAFQSLQKMRDYAQANGIAYHLLLFPILEPYASWKTYDKDTRDDLLRIARELEVEMVDLLPVSERMIAEGIDPQSRPGDTWHPSERMGEEAAKYIVQKNPAIVGRANRASK